MLQPDRPANGNRQFRPINRGYDAVFQRGRLSLGLVVPIESYPGGSVPVMERHLERVKLAEQLGFSAVWLRDVPFDVPSFGDAGQTYDPFVYLGLLAGQTERIALGVASIVLPLRHPAHVAKAAAIVDVLSEGRLILGVASGDRPEEFPAMNVPFGERGELFRAAFDYIRGVAQPRPTFATRHGRVGSGTDMLPKPHGERLPLLITGTSRQDTDWLVKHGDGWMIYPRPVAAQAQIVRPWRESLQAAGEPDKPVMQPLYVDLAAAADKAPQPIHLGFRLGTDHLVAHLKSLEEIGVNHVAVNLRFNQAGTEATLARLANDVLPALSN
ncbi:MAG: LLM class oxidoreductase [bacterium]|nr:LLM class oxidoreductase [bacterium]